MGSKMVLLVTGKVNVRHYPKTSPEEAFSATSAKDLKVILGILTTGGEGEESGQKKWGIDDGNILGMGILKKGRKFNI